ncbi:hypothetical protein DPM19_29490 [Actinomadura craniellae]|uniref:SaeA fourth Fn3-like domain-containing protein n=1 Tax=Actinomadura craniellae TaxID=2231787 RepID=A0A365GY50_9ACTN|nr:hypothetical protein [Actinomadura craniellae]RAY11746.1 hypothetical protein DPM19_29490 [Actinomadura craniellae]
MNVDEEYKREVLEPARAAGDQPPEDLRVRYRLREPLRAAEVTAQVKQVRQCWRRARGQLKYRKLIDRLEAEHRQLAPLFSAAERGDLGPLTARLRGGRERTERRRAEARSRLVDAAGSLRLVAPAEVAVIARSGGVTGAELEALAKQDGIEIREPDALATSPPAQGYPKARESLDVLGHRHLADFLFGPRLTGPMRVLDGFAAPGVRLDAETVAAVAAEWARRPRDTSSTHAGTVLAVLRQAGEPDALIRYDVVERLRERYRQRASERALLRHAIEGLGVEPGDARRLVFAVLREAAPAGGLAGRLRALLDAGEAHAAALLAERAGLPAGELTGDAGEAQVLAAEARQRLAAALRLREAAESEVDPDRAWQLLTEALHLVRDLPGADERLRRLPPRPVPRLRAVPDGRGARLSWAESPSTGGELRYLVVRRRDRAPHDPADGDTVPAGRTGAHDDRPPANVPLFYAVFARRGEATTAPATAGPVFVRPEPAAVELTTGDGVVTGRWQCPAEAARVVVVRDGVTVPADREGFRDRVSNGVTHHYRIAAVYLGPDGREVETPGVRISATPNAPPDPIYEFQVRPDPADSEQVIITFTPPRRGTAEFVLLREPPPWPRSALLPVAELRQVSKRLPAEPTVRGTAVRTGSSGWLLAVTVAGTTAAIGACHRHIDLPPPGGLLAERRGPAVHLGFDWPKGITEVELTYRIGSASPERTAISRADYDAQGGLRLPAPEDEPVEVSVAAAGLIGDARMTGPAVALTVPERLLVTYDVATAGPPWRRTLTVTAASARPVEIGRLVLVLREGRVMPQRPGDGETVGSWTEVSLPCELTVPLPRRAGPYWLRCFAEDEDIELSDPPVRRLQIKG